MDPAVAELEKYDWDVEEAAVARGGNLSKKRARMNGSGFRKNKVEMWPSDR